MSSPRDLRDQLARPLRNLRLSVTDRCNFRCTYCMPEREYVWLPKSDILTFDETRRVVSRFVDLGVDRVRLTGGEPLLRTDLPVLIGMLAEDGRIRDIAMTTNGVLLPELGPALRDAGLKRVTISLDTLRPDRFARLAGRDMFDRVMRGIECAVDLGLDNVKINTVVIRGENDDEVVPMLEFARRAGVEVRFIEYMDVGGATNWRGDSVFSRAQILERLRAEFGAVREIGAGGSAPAARYALACGTEFGIISSTTQPFCRSCDRSRVTADGMWYTCLYAARGINLRDALRAGASDAELRELIARVWTGRSDRAAEQRLELERRSAYADVSELREDPHLEMHTRGG